ncbi:MAG: type I DNA topoisomerase [Saprospiraceae bacterium]|nr:type I DNA topoisomerase [Saprospiraceae bacterium]
MGKHLLIVESPAKAKTIEKYLGKDFTVKSSYGHIRDLDKGDKGVDVDNAFTPTYIITPDKQKVVKELKALVKKSEEVWLATDEDREGEAISWHLCEVLGLDPHTTKRIVFHEITKPAIQNAILSPRTVDLHLVDAQQARRILDRLVGFELSELLWKKVRGKLSAGRVQSVAVKLIVDRDRDIQKFETSAFWRVLAEFTVLDADGRAAVLKAELPGRLKDAKEARTYLEGALTSTFTISDIDVSPLKKKPAPPFNTSTLQQEASRKLGFSVQRTMSAAQKLYESGHITYMRTDSLNLSSMAIAAMAQEIETSYGAEYVHTRKFKSKGANTQEAHEAIRPTYMERRTVTGDRDLQRLYELIWKRSLASQMAEARLEKTTVTIDVSGNPGQPLQAVGEVLKFDGFLKVYLEGRDEEDEDEAKGILPPLSAGQKLNMDNMLAQERFTRPPARYTEASLVKKMEELGIGRPSTYAPTISKITEPGRGYVVKESRDGTPRDYQVLELANGAITGKTLTENTGAAKNHLFPTDMGILVTDFLDEHFEGIMDYQFTADIEKQFDDIAEGTKAWQKMLASFYSPFHQQVELTQNEADRASGERILGIDPVSGRSVLTRMSRFGPVVQIGKPEELGEDEKPVYANLNAGQSMTSIELAEAMELFKLPRDLGEHAGKPVIIGAGRYGPYVKFGDQFISLAKGEDPMAVDMDRAVELIKEKEKADAPMTTWKGEPVTRGKGRFGPFIKWKSTYANVPARFDFDTLTPEQAIELLEAKVAKEANRYIHNWDKEKISVENGRWGPFIKYKKKNFKLPKGEDGKMTPEEAANLTLEDVKKIINEQEPGSFK